jgi:hypothetical protein
MAKIVLNPAIQIISGEISGFVYRHLADGSIVVAKAGTRNKNLEPTPAQLIQIQKFKEASARYTRLIQDPGIKAAYEQVLAVSGPTARLRALVMGDIMSPPKINTLDLSHYQGHRGDTLRVLAEDNVGVAQLELTIRDQTSRADLETGRYDFAGKTLRSVEWVYSATQTAPAEHIIEVHVTAYDLAGNKAEQTSAK